MANLSLIKKNHLDAHNIEFDGEHNIDIYFSNCGKIHHRNNADKQTKPTADKMPFFLISVCTQ